MASRRKKWRKRIKRVGRAVRRSAKKIGRRVAVVGAKILPYVVGATAGVVSFALPGIGTAIGAGITALGAVDARYMGATAARAKGMRGREARAAGRKLRKRTVIAGTAGTVAGTVGYLVGSGTIGVTDVLGAAGTVGGIYEEYKKYRTPSPSGSPEVIGPKLPGILDAGAGGNEGLALNQAEKPSITGGAAIALAAAGFLLLASKR